MATLVDTSVWVDLFRGAPTAQVARLKALVGHEELVLGDLIFAEILQGLRTGREARQVEAALRSYPVLELVGEATARLSADHYRELRRRGITVRKTIDCLIATWCIARRVPLLHNDKDFRPFVQLGLVEA
ncbi:MAG: PIN domain nuclease [Deltaproteobacteria bacterium]|nr:PIN domain nuclease [Deltaproteobacteria bacterium]